MVANILVVAGGARPDPAAVSHFLESLPPVLNVVAVDSGLDHGRALNLSIDAVVGDLDSVSADGLAWARSNGVAVNSFPAEKDETDLELGIAEALRRQQKLSESRRAKEPAPPMLSFVGLSGDRADHVLANLQVVAGPGTRSSAVRALLADSVLYVVGGDRVESTVVIRGQVGRRVSLHPLGGTASGITTSGLAYPLNDEPLSFGTARGVSNLLAEPEATITVRAGTLLVLQEVDYPTTTDRESSTGGELDAVG